MRMQVSAIALAAALLAVPQIANAQFLDVDVSGDSGGLDVDANIGGSDGLSVDAGIGSGNDGGASVDAGVNVGGSSGVDVDAGVDVGGSSGLDVDADVGIGGSDGLSVDASADLGQTSGSSRGQSLDVDATIGLGSGGTTSAGKPTTGPNGGTLIDLGAAVTVGNTIVGSTPQAPTTPATPAAPRPAPLIGTGISLSALNDTARIDAVADLLNSSNIAEIDLDAVIDDRNVSILFVNDLLGENGTVEINELLADNADNYQAVLDAIAGSNVLTSVLGNQGIDLDDVVAIQVRGDGATEVLVLDDVVKVAIGGNTTGTPADGNQAGTLPGLGQSDLSTLDVAVLTDEELARVDLSLLPNEDQRLAAVVRLLGQDGADTETETGSQPASRRTLRILDLDALLDDQSIAEVDAVLGSEGDDVVLSADLLDQLDEFGLSPETAVALRRTADGNTDLFINAGLGDNAGTSRVADIADIDISLGTEDDTGGSTDGNTGGNTGNGSTGSGGNNTGGNTGGGTGGGTGSGTNGGGSDGSGSDGSDAGEGTDGSGSGGTGGSDASEGDTDGSGTSSIDTDENADGNLNANAVTQPVVTAIAPVGGAQPGLFAQLGCNAGVAAMQNGDSASPAEVAQAESLELVKVIGCAGQMAPADIEMIHASIRSNDQLAKTLNDTGVAVQHVIGATASDGIVTLFVNQTIS